MQSVNDVQRMYIAGNRRCSDDDTQDLTSNAKSFNVVKSGKPQAVDRVITGQAKEKSEPD